MEAASAIARSMASCSTGWTYWSAARGPVACTPRSRRARRTSRTEATSCGATVTAMTTEVLRSCSAPGRWRSTCLGLASVFAAPKHRMTAASAAAVYSAARRPGSCTGPRSEMPPAHCGNGTRGRGSRTGPPVRSPKSTWNARRSTTTATATATYTRNTRVHGPVPRQRRTTATTAATRSTRPTGLPVRETATHAPAAQAHHASGCSSRTRGRAAVVRGGAARASVVTSGLAVAHEPHDAESDQDHPGGTEPHPRGHPAAVVGRVSRVVHRLGGVVDRLAGGVHGLRGVGGGRRPLRAVVGRTGADGCRGLGGGEARAGGAVVVPPALDVTGGGVDRVGARDMGGPLALAAGPVRPVAPVELLRAGVGQRVDGADHARDRVGRGEAGLLERLPPAGRVPGRAAGAHLAAEVGEVDDDGDAVGAAVHVHGRGGRGRHERGETEDGHGQTSARQGRGGHRKRLSGSGHGRLPDRRRDAAGASGSLRRPRRTRAERQPDPGTPARRDSSRPTVAGQRRTSTGLPLGQARH